jgi:hypothetical protein
VFSLHEPLDNISSGAVFNILGGTMLNVRGVSKSGHAGTFVEREATECWRGVERAHKANIQGSQGYGRPSQVDAVKNYLGNAVGRMYVERHFPAERKAAKPSLWAANGGMK